MDACTQTLGHLDREDAKTLYEYIVVEDDKPKLENMQSQTTEDPTQAFFTYSEVEAVTTAEMRKSKSNQSSNRWAKLVRE